MKRKHFIQYIFMGVLSCLSISSIAQAVGKTYAVPLAGNAFITAGQTGEAEISGRNGLVKWSSDQEVVSVYFRAQKAGKLTLKLKAKNDAGKSKIAVDALGKKAIVNVESTALSETAPFSINVTSPGYVQVNLKGLSKSGSNFANVTELLVSGEAASEGLLFSNDPEYYYWSRRGPSCHLNYTVPTEGNVSYYYNEVTVPQGEDKIGSYFMANGFGEGYFGIQVNSETERRILFSVWSPFHTDDPKSIPEEQKIHLLKKGKDVHSGEFGNEGAGGQSYRKYFWKAGVTYKFLLKGVPDGKGNTDYTAWFFVPEEHAWNLIASFKRPQTNTYLKRFHSFLENFSPNQGYLGRQVEFGNQWVYDGQWKAVQEASFSVDNTYRANQRIDAIGGITKNGYFLRNGGFFNDVVKPGSKFEFQHKNNAPKINFDKLP
ncbi:DUF3472 domain-containing protein [uncultured Sphingobacterium sp.]|uniref:DUF3472 domain-containing protein n=1 Tax=uncultured Sphingobacterium sp. TaxID=182688 RepID=UPI0025D3B2AC|nr:DUF3472 domain-containing protein [uncultured Sphingobacterium sp.]